MKQIKEINGKTYWRALKTDKPGSGKIPGQKLPENTNRGSSNISRRNFLGLIAASLSAAGISGCRRPAEKIIPYVIQPEELIPGIPQYYATTMPFGNSAYGLIVESHEGRPTKIEGNPEHPSTKGASNVFMQAALLELYDTERSKNILQNKEKKELSDFISFWKKHYINYKGNNGSGLAVLSEPFSSPTLNALADNFRSQFPKAQWITYEPVSDENITQVIKLAFGDEYQQELHIEKADVILSIDSDFLLTESESTSNTSRFSEGRNILSENDSMNRLYVVESSYSVTGAAADHRMRIQCSKMYAFAAELAVELEKQGLKIGNTDSIKINNNETLDRKWISAVAEDLLRAKGRSLITAGRKQPLEVHALVLVLNSALGNIGNTIVYRKAEHQYCSNSNDLAGLVQNISDGEINTLIIMGGNPVYNAPFDFETLLNGVENVIHLSNYINETSLISKWHIPQAHFLESWGDAEAVDGTLSIIQPLIEPLFGGISRIEFLNLIVNGHYRKGYDIVRLQWEKHLNNEFENEWRRVLHDGLLKKSHKPISNPKINYRSLKSYLKDYSFKSDAGNIDNLEIIFHPSPSVYDGRFANNGWLHELPDPVTKIAWDNPAMISPKTADELGLKNGDVVVLNYKNKKSEIPVCIVPGHADFSVSLTLGYGRTEGGNIAKKTGFNAYELRTFQNPHFDTGLKIAKTEKTYLLACTQKHSNMEGRPIIREASIQEYKQNPHFAEEMVEHPPLESMWKEHNYDEGYQWGVVVDLNLCIGCNACVIACQIENNVPVVGKKEVSLGREMHWLRMDRYFSGNSENPEMVFQPIFCQHCENAPCEQVCPFAATVHDTEGLNNMVYNRCVGTRYCSNNCPYKVRRFNFFNYNKNISETEKMAKNPDVTIRSRGVMEKCSYCLQRISRAKIKTRLQGRKVADGEIQTACQQACPADAIIFGNINDKTSRVSKLKENERNYALLGELNVKPRTSYLAKLRNPNPEISNK